MNRKERRAAEAKGQGQQVRQAPQPLDKATEERLDKLLKGEIDPPNTFVAYLIEKANGSRSELIALQNNIQQGNQQLAAMQQQALRLQGEVGKYIEDIRAWDKKVVAGDKPAETPVAPTAEKQGS